MDLQTMREVRYFWAACPLFTQQVLLAALIFALTENQKNTIQQLVGEAILVDRAYLLEYPFFLWR